MQIETDTEDILFKSLDRGRMKKEEAYELMISGSIHHIGKAADTLRLRLCGDAVSYVVNRNINFTNICSGTCRFCAYRVSKDSKNGFLMNQQEIESNVREALKAGSTEVCLQGGLHPDIDLDYYTSMLRSIKSQSNVHIHAFSPMEVHYMAEKSGIGLKETLLVLKENGLGSMPGTAAEIFDSEVREQICPDKISTREWIRIVRTAHKLKIPTTATMLYGHIERHEHRINHLDVIRKLQDETGGFTEFVPLSFIHYNTALKSTNPHVKGATGLDDLMVYAVSRLYLDNFRNIQASWVKLGNKLAQIALYYGANDMGGTIMNENITTSAGKNVEFLSASDLTKLIQSVGRIPVKRDTVYNYI